jgi:hypothetical protein
MFNPSSIKRFFWDLLCMILIFYALFAIPFRISFEEEGDVWNIFDMIDIISDFIFLTDILFNFNTSIYSKGITILNYTTRKTYLLKEIDCLELSCILVLA